MLDVARLFVLTVAAVLLASVSASDTPATEAREPISAISGVVAGDGRRISLGERLFNDLRLSHENNVSCASCHPLDRGGMDGQPRAITPSGALHPRNTPTVFNVALNSSFNWDGVAKTLEAHAEVVLLNPRLMNTTWPELLAKLRADRDYSSLFGAAYADGLTQENVLNALAEFERSLLTPDSRFDRYLRGDKDVLSAREQRGYRLFKSYGCIACHQGVNIGGNMFQKFGIFGENGNRVERDGPTDLGRYAFTKIPRDRGVFRVPSLRNVALTAPYFHDGRASTLESAVEKMGKVQLGRELTQEEIGLIVEFLSTLTGEYRGRPLGASLNSAR